MNSQIENLINRYGDQGSFTCVAPTKEMLDEVKEILGFPIPDQFLEYLNIYSHGGIGFEILGIGFDGSISFLEETLETAKTACPKTFLSSRIAKNGFTALMQIRTKLRHGPSARKCASNTPALTTTS